MTRHVSTLHTAPSALHHIPVRKKEQEATASVRHCQRHSSTSQTTSLSSRSVAVRGVDAMR
eukprot:1164851-Rhodomonas_salina.1